MLLTVRLAPVKLIRNETVFMAPRRKVVAVDTLVRRALHPQRGELERGCLGQDVAIPVP